MVFINNGNALKCDNYVDDLTISLKDMLQQKELTDVTLVADGHLYNAHRLVLSALSPYFRQMFTQMPVNQQAFVFLKDVSKETLERLITFIYLGKANVKQEHLEEFFKTANALNIKGLADGGYSNDDDVQLPVFNSFTPSYNNLQYQSTRTVPIPDRIKRSHDESSHYEPRMDTLYQQHDNFEYDDSGEMNVNGNEYGDYISSDAGDGDSTAMNQESAMQDDQWNIDPKFSAEEKPAQMQSFIAKRAKTNIDTSEYNTVADIRTNINGQQNLFIANHKFSQHHQSNGYGQQRWRCTMQRNKKCRAAASTMDVNGIVMMKNLCAEHTHG